MTVYTNDNHLSSDLSSNEGKNIQLEILESHIAVCDHTTRSGAVFCVRTEEGCAQVYSFFNANPGDVVWLSIKKSVPRNGRLPLAIVESIIEYAPIPSRTV